jgi:hypothetical protein
MEATSVQILAIKIMRQHEAQYALYLADCEADRKRGHRPSRCEHGVNLWTDHDPMCGSCEEGHSIGDPAYRRSIALHEAKARIAKADKISMLMFDLMQLMPGMDIRPTIAEVRRLYGLDL